MGPMGEAVGEAEAEEGSVDMETWWTRCSHSRIEFLWKQGADLG